MTTQIRRRRGTTAQHASFTGAAGEITVDTDKKVVVVHDGITAGGFPLARAGLDVPSLTQALRDDVDQNAQTKSSARKVNILKNTLQAREVIYSAKLASSAPYLDIDVSAYEAVHWSGKFLNASSGATMLMSVSYDGISFSIGSNYEYAVSRSQSGGVTSADGATTATSAAIGGSNVGINSSSAFGGVRSSGVIEDIQAGARVRWHATAGFYNSAGSALFRENSEGQNFFGTGLVQKIRFWFSTGDLAAGSRLTVEGVRG